MDAEGHEYRPGRALLVLFLLVAILSAVFFLLVCVPCSSYPSEDAAMLYLYSENVAHTGVIAYNAGGERAEGATDFLWMAILAGLHRMGLPTYLCATVLSALALMGTSWLLWRLTDGASALSILGWEAFLLALPTVFGAVQGFSPLFFGFWIAVCAFCFLRGKAALLMAAGFVTCLIRPDGLVFVAPLVLCFLWSDRLHLGRNLWLLLVLAILPGALYFLWRWRYFGQLLPLPFYVKSDFPRFALFFERDSLLVNAKFLAALAPVALVALLALRRAGRPDRVAAGALAFSLIAVPFVFYSSMNLMQNIGFRFQYPLALSVVAVACCLRRFLARPWILGGAAAVSVILLSPWYAMEGVRTIQMPEENIPRVAKALGGVTPRGTMAVTEAGRLPYYSGWETVDLWGLNTPALARKLVTPADVRRLRSDLIVLHALGEDYAFVDAPNPVPRARRTWTHMVVNAYIGARLDTYDLWMVPHRDRTRRAGFLGELSRRADRAMEAVGYRRKFDVHYLFLVRRDSPGAPAVEQVLREHGAVDFATYRERKAAWER